MSDTDRRGMAQAEGPSKTRQRRGRQGAAQGPDEARSEAMPLPPVERELAPDDAGPATGAEEGVDADAPRGGEAEAVASPAGPRLIRTFRPKRRPRRRRQAFPATRRTARARPTHRRSRARQRDGLKATRPPLRSAKPHPSRAPSPSHPRGPARRLARNGIRCTSRMRRARHPRPRARPIRHRGSVPPARRTLRRRRAGAMAALPPSSHSRSPCFCRPRCLPICRPAARSIGRATASPASSARSRRCAPPCRQSPMSRAPISTGLPRGSTRWRSGSPTKPGASPPRPRLGPLPRLRAPPSSTRLLETPGRLFCAPNRPSKRARRLASSRRGSTRWR